MLTYMLIILEVCESLRHSRGTNLHCTPSACIGFCSGELIVLLFTAEMDCSAGRQRSMEFYSVTQLTKRAFIASVTPIINYSPKLSAGLAGCYGNVPHRPPRLHAVAVICLLTVVLFSCLPLMYSPWDTLDSQCYSSNALCTDLSSVSDVSAGILEIFFPLTLYLTCGRYNSSADTCNCTCLEGTTEDFRVSLCV